MTLEYVENVGRLRFSLVAISQLLHDHFIAVDTSNTLCANDKRIIDKLLSLIKASFVVVENLNQEKTHAFNFFIKEIIRRYGMSTLLALYTKVENMQRPFSWLIPKQDLSEVVSFYIAFIYICYWIYGNYSKLHTGSYKIICFKVLCTTFTPQIKG